jgi:glutamate 5-kinase
MIDAGAAHALKQGKSLLFAGVTAISGEFSKGDLLAIYCYEATDYLPTEQGEAQSVGFGAALAPTKKLLAKGLSHYDGKEAMQLIGKRSDEIFERFGENTPQELIHRNNLVMLV